MVHLNVHRRTHEALLDTLIRSHRIKLDVVILDSQERSVGHFQTRYGSSRVLAGSVDVDTTQDVTRSLELELFDPRRRLAFTPEGASEAGVFTGYFVEIRRLVLVPHHNLYPRRDLHPSSKLFPGSPSARHPESAKWVHCPLFRGPLTHFAHVGGHVTIEGQGKESLGLAPHYAAQGYRLSKGMHIDDAIKHVLGRIGETRFAIPDLPYKLKHHRAVHPRDEPWRIVALGSEDSNGHRAGPLIDRTGKHPHYIYIDGRGDVRIKRLNKKPVHVFDDNWLLEPPEIDYEGLEFINRVEVRGVKPKGKGKKRASAVVQLPKENPLSPENLERAGQKPLLRTRYIDTDLDTDHKCRQRAWHVLKHGSEVALEASFSCLPMPLLEELDVVRVVTEHIHAEFPLTQFSIPLTAGPMTIGRNKRIPAKPVRTDRNPFAGPARGGRGGSG